jgi:hypothetical protein
MTPHSTKTLINVDIRNASALLALEHFIHSPSETMARRGENRRLGLANLHLII